MKETSTVLWHWLHNELNVEKLLKPTKVKCLYLKRETERNIQKCADALFEGKICDISEAFRGDETSTPNVLVFAEHFHHYLRKCGLLHSMYITQFYYSSLYIFALLVACNRWFWKVFFSWFFVSIYRYLIAEQMEDIQSWDDLIYGETYTSTFLCRECLFFCFAFSSTYIMWIQILSLLEFWMIYPWFLYLPYCLPYCEIFIFRIYRHQGGIRRTILINFRIYLSCDIKAMWNAYEMSAKI